MRILWALLIAAVVLCSTTNSDEGTAEKFEFQAEVNRLMDIIIHSLYTNKDIFLRELISNASDALDKIRFLMLTSDALKQDDTDLEIRIQADHDANTLTIIDRGIGMIKEDLIANLGTVARSGTTKFVEAASAGGDNAMGLIGQFGVGFYSAFLVADKVTFTTKHVNDTQYVWVSDAKTGFEVFKDPAGETLGKHGTSITLHLKDDAKSYLEDKTLRDVVNKYSEFINFPIFLQTSKEVDKEVPVEEEESAPVEKDEGEDEGEKSDLDITEEDSDAPAKPTTRKIKETVKEWERVNTVKPLWTRPMEEISEEEYTNFYKSIAKDEKEPLIHSHFKAEGSVEFKGLLYIPSVAPHDLYDRYYTDANRAIKVYVRRVLLTDAIEKDALPQYLNFVKGVVDSEDLPINVNRESLQKDNKILKTIGKKLARKVINMLEDLAALPAPEPKEKEEPKESEEEKDEDKKEDEPVLTPYETFWGQFSRSIKLGVLEDKKNKGKLEKLLRFRSVNSPKKLISLEEYVAAMPEEQKDIYYISGPNQGAVEKSPMLERIKLRKYDCLFFVDNLDEYLAGGMTEFDGKKLLSVTKEGLDLGGLTDDEKELNEDIEEAFKDTLKYMRETLKDRKVTKVEISKRLENTPAVLTTTRWGWTANMERIMRGQAMTDFDKQAFMMGGRTLEVNPRHPIIKDIKRRIDTDETDDLESTVNLLLDAALIHSGFIHEDVTDFVERIHKTLETNLGVQGQPLELPVVPKKEKKPVEEEPADVESEEFEDDDDEEKEEL